MHGLAGVRSGAPERPFSPWWTFVSARRAWLAPALAVVLGLLTAWAGPWEAPVPSATGDGDATMPMWRLLATGAGTLPALGLHSVLTGLEETGSDVHRTAERRYLLWLSAACFTLYLVIASATLEPLITVTVSKSLPGWLGLALISGRLLGRRLAWVLPAGIMCVLGYWNGSTQEWWDFGDAAPQDVRSLLVSACLLAGGLLSWWATPWRLTRLTRGR